MNYILYIINELSLIITKCGIIIHFSIARCITFICGLKFWCKK